MTSNFKERRLKLQKVLRAIPGVKRVYYQEPGNVKMEYPCIVYHRDGGNTKFADDNPYEFRRRYTLTVIDPDPDSDIPDIIATSLPMCIADRHFTSNNLHHNVFTLYF